MELESTDRRTDGKAAAHSERKLQCGLERRDFLVSRASRLALGPEQLRTRQTPRALSPLRAQ